jgi:hypothetical protein
MKKFLVPCAVALAAGTLAVSASAAAWQLLSVAGSDLVGATHVTKSGVGNDALHSFSIQYKSGDHKIAKLGILPTVDRVDVALTDKDGGDPFKVLATYSHVPSLLQTKRVSKICSVECTLPIEVPSHRAFVLRGFWFERTTGETNVRRIAVRPNGNSAVNVVYRDNGQQAFKVVIEYGHMQKEFVKHRATVSGVRNGGQQTLNIKTPLAAGDVPVILQGFDVQFDNGDHHLGQFAIKRVTSGYDVTFNDQNYDDPYHAIVDYMAVQ